jgi:hypothetical protein
VGNCFSRRHGFSSGSNGSLIYHDAPESVRVGLLTIIHDTMGTPPSGMRSIVCGALRVRPDPGNWSEYPNIWGEVEGLVFDADWYEVYDIIEAFATAFIRHGRQADQFEELVNGLLIDEGIGWRLNCARLEMHGDEALESVLGETEEELEESGFRVAAKELKEARSDLSRRPEPDLSGAVHHAMAALESIAREASGSPKLTLGEIIKKRPSLIPAPVDDAAAKLWGFASEQARHARESRDLAWEETLLIVGVAGALCSYLNAKLEAETVSGRNGVGDAL